MSDAGLAHQIRALHAETIAAIGQRQAVAVNARSALIAALRDRLICLPGCEDALATWGLVPLPRRWTVSAEAHLTYTRLHTDLGEAREQARFGVPDDLHHLQPAMAVYPRQVIDVTPDGGDQPGPERYRITVQVTLRTWVTATRVADAHAAARTTVEGHLPALAATPLG